MNVIKNRAISSIVLIALLFLFLPMAGVSAEEIPLAEIKDYVESAYVGPVSEEVLTAKTAEELFELLGDVHSGYLNPKEFEDFRISSSQEYAGVGMQLMLQEEYATVTKVFPGTPAEKAGVEVGDKIELINGEQVQGWPLDEIVSLIRGEPGSSVMIQFLREGEVEPFIAILSRENIHVDALEYKMIENGIGYILLETFTPSAGEEFQSAIDNLLEQGMRGLVFDLRQNGGGYLSAALDIGAVFVGENAHLLHVVGRDNDPVTYQSLTEALDIPMAVLVDDGSASAAEIVAGIIQDYQAGRVIGINTYGKASVQTIFPLSNGGAVKLTTARYLTPKEQDLNGVGLTPDLMEEDQEQQMELALAYLKEQMGNSPAQILSLSPAGAKWNGAHVALIPKPYVVEDRLMVPLRRVGELFGLEIQWDGTKNQILGSVNNREFTLMPDNSNAVINGREEILSTAPRIENGRTFISVEVLADLLGAQLDYDEGTKTFILSR